MKLTNLKWISTPAGITLGGVLLIAVAVAVGPASEAMQPVKTGAVDVDLTPFVAEPPVPSIPVEPEQEPETPSIKQPSRSKSPLPRQGVPLPERREQEKREALQDVLNELERMAADQ